VILMRKRKSKKTRKYLGKRSHGAGDVKNRRGSGNRGGRGMAGMAKHRWTTTTNMDRDSKTKYFSKNGFTNPRKSKTDVINLYQINQMAVLGQLKKSGNKHLFEFNGKVLATGKVTTALLIKASSWSKNVEKKLKENDGEISQIAPETA